MTVREPQLKKWEKTRAMGRGNYIVRYGVLGGGVSVALFWTVFMCWSFKTWSFDDERFLRTVGIALVLFPIGGFFWGRWVWRESERVWHEAQGAEPGS